MYTVGSQVINNNGPCFAKPYDDYLLARSTVLQN